MPTIPSAPRLPRRLGFTLIELLVVIAIVSLMIAILLPALSAARYQSRLTLCASSVRQVGLSTLLYAAESQDYFPNYQWATTLVEGGYLRSDADRFCPIEADSTNSFRAARTAYYSTAQARPGPGWSYAINVALAFPAGWGTYTTALPARVSEVQRPSKGMLHSDSAHRGPYYPHRNDYVDMIFFGRTDAAFATPPHVGTDGITRGINIQYIDGHGSFMGYRGGTTITQVRSHRDYACNYKSYWAIPDTQSWNLAPYLD